MVNCRRWLAFSKPPSQRAVLKQQRKRSAELVCSSGRWQYNDIFAFSIHLC